MKMETEGTWQRGRPRNTWSNRIWRVLVCLYHEDAWDSPDRDHCRLKIKQKMANPGLCQMSKTFIGSALCREFESEALAAEELLD